MGGVGSVDGPLPAVHDGSPSINPATESTSSETPSPYQGCRPGWSGPLLRCRRELVDRGLVPLRQHHGVALAVSVTAHE